MRDLREGSGGADVDPLRVATLAGLAVTFAMAAALRQRRTNNAAQAADNDDEPAAARPRARVSKSAKSSSDATGRSSLRHRGVVIALLAALLSSLLAYIARDRIPFPTSLGKPDPVRATVRALSAVNRLAPAPPRSSIGDRCAGYDDTAVRPILGAYNDGVPGVPTAVALGDIDGLVPQNAGDDVRDLVRQGLAMRFGFNCDEARRNFVASAELAATRDGVGCAVCLWGIARSLMPDVNNYKTSRHSRDAARAALAAAEGAIIDAHQSQSSDEFQKKSKKLSTLVASARAFFGTHEPSDGDSESAQLAAHERYLTHLYRAVSSGDDEFASDADLLALAGEAAMNLTPWRYWRRDGSYANPDPDPRRKPEPKRVKHTPPRDVLGNWVGSAAGAAGAEGGADTNTAVRADADDNNSVTTFGIEAEVEERKSEGAHTAEALTALTSALRIKPGHLLAAHMLVHLTESLPPPKLRRAVDGEASFEGSGAEMPNVNDTGAAFPVIAEEDSYLTAALGETAADALASLAPHAGISPHLVHMAAHNYVRVGRWRDAVKVSKAAIAADAAMRNNCLYPYGGDHDAAMLVAAAAMGGDRGVAVTHAQHPGGKGGAADSYAGITTGFYPASKLLMHARFGEWDEIGKMADEAEATRVAITQEYIDANPDGLTNAERWTWRVSDSGWGRAIWAYVLGLWTTKDGVEPMYPDDEFPEPPEPTRVTDTWREITGLEWIDHLRKVTVNKITDADEHAVVPGLTARDAKSPFEHFSPFCPWKRQIASIMVETVQAAYVVKGEYTPSKRDMAKYHLQTAAKAYDQLPYFEPEHHYLPPRQCLGEFFLRTGDFANAYKQFARDLDRDHPENPWSLSGLERASQRTFGTTSACNEVFTP